MSAALTLQMPPDVASNVILATQTVSTDAPAWAVAHDAVYPHHNGHFEVMGSRSYHDIFRLPNMGGVVRDWLFTRPSMEAVGEDSFANCAAESTTIFRIEKVNTHQRAITVTPTVSSHWLLVPCQTINGFTVGLVYLDVTYERDPFGNRDNRVPPLRFGRFVIEDATGEAFLTGWAGDIMVVDWTQSIIKCERVREILQFEAPPVNGMTPRNLLLRNSFFQRRNCALCGCGPSISSLPPPCSGINKRISQDPTMPPVLTNIASLYRRFRGSFFGVALKTPYGADRKPKLQQLVPILTEAKYGLHTMRTSFKNNLRKNVDIVLGAASNNGYFGLNPRSASRVLLLRASHPVDAEVSAEEEVATRDVSESMGSRRGASMDRGRSCSPLSVMRGEGSIGSTLDGGAGDDHTSEHHDRAQQREGRTGDGVSVARRSRVEDPLDRDSILHKRKVRNRISAQKSNKMRKLMLESKRTELKMLKTQVVPHLRVKLEQLQNENRCLRVRVHGDIGLVELVEKAETGAERDEAEAKGELDGEYDLDDDLEDEGNGDALSPDQYEEDGNDEGGQLDVDDMMNEVMNMNKDENMVEYMGNGVLMSTLESDGVVR